MSTSALSLTAAQIASAIEKMVLDPVSVWGKPVWAHYTLLVKVQPHGDVLTNALTHVPHVNYDLRYIRGAHAMTVTGCPANRLTYTIDFTARSANLSIRINVDLAGVNELSLNRVPLQHQMITTAVGERVVHRQVLMEWEPGQPPQFMTQLAMKDGSNTDFDWQPSSDDHIPDFAVILPVWFFR